MNSIYFAKNALLIRRSLVRAQVEEPKLVNEIKPLREIVGAFFIKGVLSFVRSSQLVGNPTIHSFPIRTECPPGACNCGRDALLQSPDSDLRVMRLTREDEKRLLLRLENLDSLSDLKHMEERMAQQVGIRLSISISPNEVRSLRGITILAHEQLGLCRKTRQAIPAAIKRSLEKQPAIAHEILNVGGLFEIE